MTTERGYVIIAPQSTNNEESIMDIIVKVTSDIITHIEVGKMSYSQFYEFVVSLYRGFDTIEDTDSLEITIPEMNTRYKLLIINC